MTWKFAFLVIIFHTAPSPPRDVSVRMVTPTIAEVSWREPAVPNGVVTQYTVYAIPLGSVTTFRGKRQADATASSETIKMVTDLVTLLVRTCYPSISLLLPPTHTLVTIKDIPCFSEIRQHHTRRSLCHLPVPS